MQKGVKPKKSLAKCDGLNLAKKKRGKINQRKTKNVMWV